LDNAVAIYVGVGLMACALALVGLRLHRWKPRARPHTDEALLDAIIERQSPGSERGRPTKRASSGGLTGERRPVAGGSRLALLEGHLCIAILDANARERLVGDAMRATGGDRVAAIQKVLHDLREEDKRLS
jgi:hypothetical protein